MPTHVQKPNFNKPSLTSKKTRKEQSEVAKRGKPFRGMSMEAFNAMNTEGLSLVRKKK